jgi:hypothetical protein
LLCFNEVSVPVKGKELGGITLLSSMPSWMEVRGYKILTNINLKLDETRV